MNFYWLYDIPNWLFASIVVSLLASFGVFGVILSRAWVRRLHKVDHSHNDIVGYFLGMVTVVYGITLGLVAVGTWDGFSATNDKVSLEAQIVASIYRDIGSYPEPLKTRLKADLRNYTRNVIDVGWPLQRKGIVPSDSGRFLDKFQQDFMAAKPSDMSEGIIQSEVFKQFNLLIEARRARLQSVKNGLPGSIWALVIFGGMITVIVTWFFDTRSLGMHLWMTGLSAGLLGLLIFLIGTLDNPFRGMVSIGPDAFENVYSQIMAADAGHERP